MAEFENEINKIRKSSIYLQRYNKRQSGFHYKAQQDKINSPLNSTQPLLKKELTEPADTNK